MRKIHRRNSSSEKPVHQSLDFCAVVRSISQHGYSQRAIARGVGVSLGTVNNWANGVTSPRYETGDRLLFFYEEVQRKGDKPR